MAKIIKFKEKAPAPPDNLICSKPWEFRWADWESKHFLQMLRDQSDRLEKQREEIRAKGEKGVGPLPPHFVLKGGMAYTIRSVYAHRMSETKMRDVYYLAGLIDCMINRTNALLRTDLIRDMYRKVMTLKSILSMNWYGSLDRVFLPLDATYYDDSEYKASLAKATTMKALYHTIREGTDEMFDTLSLEYVFYTPRRGG
jgi:hypothetical protein